MDCFVDNVLWVTDFKEPIFHLFVEELNFCRICCEYIDFLRHAERYVVPDVLWVERFIFKVMVVVCCFVKDFRFDSVVWFQDDADVKEVD